MASKRKAKPKARLRHPVPRYVIWLGGSCLVAMLAVLGLHLWHPPIQVQLEVKAKALTFVMAPSPDTQSLIGRGLSFNGLTLFGLHTLEFIPSNTQYYQAEQSPQADVSLESNVSLAGLAIPSSSSIDISSTKAKTLQLRVSHPLSLHMLSDSTKPRLRVHNVRMGASVIQPLDIPWPQSSKLSITSWKNARLALTLPNQDQLDLLDGPPLTVTRFTSQQQDDDSGAAYSGILSGKIDYIDDTELKAVELQAKAGLLIKGNLSIRVLELDAKQGVLLVHLHGIAERLNVDRKDARPSALERFWKRPLLVILFVVLGFVVSVSLKAYDRYKESKSA